ncbi:MAG: hypothetical protein HZA22_03390 [Nitrospirae bacterium]|nr:hypothetical protein [Nitrospirota bacterium]
MFEDLKEMFKDPDEDLRIAYKEIQKMIPPPKWEGLFVAGVIIFFILISIGMAIILSTPDIFGFGLEGHETLTLIKSIVYFAFAAALFTQMVNRVVKNPDGKRIILLKEKLRVLNTGTALPDVVGFVDRLGWYRTDYNEPSKAVYALVKKEKFFGPHLFVKFRFDDNKTMKSYDVRVVRSGKYGITFGEG